MRDPRKRSFIRNIRQLVVSVASSPTAAILVLWALAVAGRFVKSGVCFDLNYSMFQPDGNLYIGMAKNLVEGNPGASPVVAWTRPLLSILSLPMYVAWGDHGLLVIPALSLLLVGWILLKIGRDHDATWAAVIAFAVLTLSVTVNRWMIADLTDAPHAALFLLAFYLLARDAQLPAIAGVLVLGTLARPAGPIWTALLVAFAWKSVGARRNWLYLLSGCALALFVIAGVSVGATGGFNRDPVSPISHLLNAPMKLLSVTFVDVAELAVLDRLLLAAVLLMTVVAWRTRTHVWARAYLLSLVASLLLSGWIGVYGVNSRYQLPSIFVGAAVVIRATAMKFPELDSSLTRIVRSR